MRKIAKQLIDESEFSITELSKKIFGKKSYLSNALNTNNGTILKDNEKQIISDYLNVDVDDIDFSKKNNAPYEMKRTPITARENQGYLKNLDLGRIKNNSLDEISDGRISRLVLLEFLAFREMNSCLSVFGAMSKLAINALKDNKFNELYEWFDSGEFTQSTFAYLWEHVDMSQEFLNLRFK